MQHTRLSGGPSVVLRLVSQTSRAAYHTSSPRHDSAPFVFRPLFGVDESSASSSSSQSHYESLKALASRASPNLQRSSESKADLLESSQSRLKKKKKKNFVTFGDIRKNQNQSRPPSKSSEVSAPRSPVTSYRTRDRFTQFTGAISSQSASSKHGKINPFDSKPSQKQAKDGSRNNDRDSLKGDYGFIRLPPDDSVGRPDSSYRSKWSPKASKSTERTADRPLRSHEAGQSSSNNRIPPSKPFERSHSSFGLVEGYRPVITRTRPTLSSSSSTPSKNTSSSSSYTPPSRVLPTGSPSDTHITLDKTTLDHLVAPQSSTAEEEKALRDLEAILRARGSKNRKNAWSQAKR